MLDGEGEVAEFVAQLGGAVESRSACRVVAVRVSRARASAGDWPSTF
ncbi:hypothetical protein ACWCQQ_38020 [Streptomyces sp. NPDC002143]